MSAMPKDEASYGGTPVLRSEAVRVTEEHAPIWVPGQARGEPEVRLVKNGDTIQAIDILCTCGQRIRLKCLYRECEEK